MRSLLFAAGVGALAGPVWAQTGGLGPSPDLPLPKQGILPEMKIPRPTGWDGSLPTVPEGYAISAIATGLKIPRQLLVLPNGDILVSEGKGQSAPVLRPKDLIAGFIKGLGKSPEAGGDRLTLLRDADGDGTYETQTVFADNLNSPYGLALINDHLFVANQDAVVRFTYEDGQTVATAPPEELARLPSAINHHWTKAMTASPDGRHLYVGIGSNSNITERGIMAEESRAMIWEINAASGAHRPYATGLRNPTALAFRPGSETLWAVVNERDEIGPDLVPDYLTSITDGGFYGWPFSYWGQNIDRRVQPEDPQKVASAIAPDYGLGAHVAALGLYFSNSSMGEEFAEGAFVGLHGSWNRKDPVGYKVIFVPFSGANPSGPPIDFVTGFLTPEGKARGRPVGVAVGDNGDLFVADDLSNTVWRITRAETL